MSFPYRCMKCRTRNTFRQVLEAYVRSKKCRSCGHDRFYVDRARLHRTDYCRCEGYHYTHRFRSPLCIHHPKYEFNVRTRRYNEDPLDVQVCIAFDAEPANTSAIEPPF